MCSDWDQLTDEAQIVLSQLALLRAAERIAAQAELLADEMESGSLTDRGGPDALRLFAAVIRTGNRDPLQPLGWN